MPRSNSESLEALWPQLMRTHHQRILAVLGKFGLYPGQPRILFTLRAEDGRTQKELAEGLKLAPATVTVMLQRMEKAGLVERKPDPADLRVTRVFLTESGRRLCPEVEAALAGLNEICFAGFTPEERILLRRFVIQLIENLSQPGSE